MTTHRIETVVHRNDEVFEISNACFTDDEYFVIERMINNNSGIRRIFNPPYTFHNIIYVLAEAPNDEKLYQTIYKKLCASNSEMSITDLIFIPVGYIDSYNKKYCDGGCTFVKKYLTKMNYDFSECITSPDE
jgi:hypothetical protein